VIKAMKKTVHANATCFTRCGL